MSLIKHQQDVAAGALCAAFGLAGFWWSFSYPMGSLHRMGPGYFPALAFGLLGLFGVVILARGLVLPGEVLDRWFWRPLCLVLVSVLFFGLAIEKLGFVVVSILMVVLACLAGARLKPISVLILAGCLTVFCLFIFVIGLGLPMPIWPDVSP